jgi:HPr kinase/phosphorylase
LTSPDPTVAIHASAVAWIGKGVLVTGDAGSGKSTLVARLLAHGAYLVADDLVRLVNRGSRLEASACGAPGLIELRGSGIFRIATTNRVPVSLCVELAPANDRERLPERSTVDLAGVAVPVLRAERHDRLAAGQVLLALCCRRVD